MTEPIESALVVLVPAADPVVDHWRERLDPAATWGVPAHITVLYPFVPPAEIDSGVVDELRELFETVPSFPFRMTEVRWFGDDVVWLAPDPSGRFDELTRLVYRHWPAFPPYGGQHADPVPHLTIGDQGPPDVMLQAAESIVSDLPITSTTEAVSLMTGSYDAGSWQLRETFPLG